MLHYRTYAAEEVLLNKSGNKQIYEPHRQGCQKFTLKFN
jgi:hypothetical protein